MTPVLQDRFYEPDAPPDQQRGNCLSAVVASLMDLPLAEVPNFVQDDVDSDGARNYWVACWAFVHNRGGRIVYVDRDGESLRDGEFYTQSGVSPRDPRVHHIVICRDGAMVHDPHPDATGVLTDNGDHWAIRL